MGECGCGSNNEWGRIKFGDFWLIVGLYRGCQDCSKVIGIDLKLVPEKDMIHDDWYDYLPDWTEKLKKDEFGMCLPIITMPNLMAAFKENAGSPEDYSDGDDFIGDNFLSVQDAVFKTQKEWDDTGKVKD